MQTKSSLLISAVLILVFCSLKPDQKHLQLDTGKAPILVANNFKKYLKEGEVINCRKIDDLGAIMYFNEEMIKHDLFQLELHRFGSNEDVLVAFKMFIPANKEFQKKYLQTDSLKLKLLTPEDQFNSSDFENNTLLFKTSYLVNDVFCTLKNKNLFNFYLVVKGYMLTGKKNKFGEDLYDNGKELTKRSITFRNWEDKTQ